MQSSGPVFTRKNPFQPTLRVGKTHYHPSRNQSLTKKKKKTALSPVRLDQQSSPHLHNLSPKEQQTFEKHDRRFAAADGHPDYAESWPSSACGSSPTNSSSSSDMEILEQSAKAGPFSTELKVQENSVLAKYIERFRHGQPQSREERRQMASSVGEEQLPFWWMSPSSLPPSSTPTKATDRDVIQPLQDCNRPTIFSSSGQHEHVRPLSPFRGSLNILSDCEFDDIQQLQERASRLLLRGEFTPSDTSAPVSSEGLGCSDFSSPVSIDEPVRRPLIPILTKFSSGKASSDSVQALSSQKSVVPSLLTPTRPEEDILFQWRLRRKMEQAREWPLSIQRSSLHGSTLSWQAPSLSHATDSRLVHKKQQRNQPPEFSQKSADLHTDIPRPETEDTNEFCSPASGPKPSPNVGSDPSVCHPQTIAHVPAHMHLLCDILPCPIQSSHGSTQQNISQTRAKLLHQKTKVSGNSTEEPTLERVASPLPASFGAAHREWPSDQIRSERDRKESEKDERKTTSFRKQMKLTRYTADPDEHCATKTSLNRGHPKKIPWAEQHHQQGSQDYPSKSSTGDHGPSSPIHSALGQVVSEVLFPTVDSSPAQKQPVSLVSPPTIASAPPQSPPPPCSAENSVEVISQLLQEAEDSDEKEFDDDPLLQVLRKQRKRVKEQISEVDSVLNKVLKEKHVI